MSEARKVTEALGGDWHHEYGSASCPVCQPERRKDQKALTVTDGCKGLVLHCHKSGCEFIFILKAIGIPGSRHARPHASRANIIRPDRSTTTSKHAEKLWSESGGIDGSPAEAYLRHIRQVDGPMPATLRFNPCVWHGPSGRNLPAMIALVEGVEEAAVSRTYLCADGAGKADLLKHEQKLMLGRVSGGHVCLRSGSGDLIVAEGIETAFSVPSLLDTRSAAIWAALSASNMRRLRLPSAPGHLIIAADGDEAGRAAALELASRATRLGWRVEIKAAPEGRDWNDVLIAQKTHRDTEFPRHSI